MDVIACKNLTKVFGRVNAISDLSFSIKKNTITGLIGRNGAGKTTLLKIMAGFLHPSSGEIQVFSENPFNSLKVSSNMIFLDDQMPLPTFLNLEDLLETAGSFYENWNMMKLAKGLFDYFAFNPKQNYQNLSKGMKSTFHMIIGLSARCSLTILDEPTTGMDSAVRKDFYRALLKDYIAYPRTIVVSSHLLNEIEDILEDVLLIDQGKKRLHMSVSDLKEIAIGLRGKTDLLNELIKKQEILHKERLGKDSSYFVVKNDFTEDRLQQARVKGAEIVSVATDDLCVYLTSKAKGGIEDVFNRN